MIQQVIDQSGIIHLFKGKQTEPIKLIIGEILKAEIMDILPTGNIQIKIDNRILNAQPQRQLPLNKGDTVYLKVEKLLPDGTIPLRVLSTSEALQLEKTIANITQEISDKIFKFIEAIFTDKGQQVIQSKQFSALQHDEPSYLNLIKAILSLPVEDVLNTEKVTLLKKIMATFSNSSSTLESIKELINLVENKSNQSLFKEQSALLNAILVSSDEPAEKLKKAVLNSGVLLETKLKQALSDPVKIESIKEDLKVILNNITTEAKSHGMQDVVDKAQQILRQIDGYQVLSKTFQSFFTFLPIFWKDVEGGNIAFKSFKRQGKDYHTVFITLQIKEESLSFIITMINRSFFVSFSGAPETMQVIKSYENDLKQRFQRQGMILGGVNYVEKVEELLKQWNIKDGLISVTV